MAAAWNNKISGMTKIPTHDHLRTSPALKHMANVHCISG
jgi:hypothetical protein